MSDLDSIFSVINDCKESMRLSGHQQWPDHHPSREVVAMGVQSGAHFVAVDGEEILGGMLLNNSQDEQYKQVEWRVNEGSPFIVHRLAISPNHQGRGVAKKLMVFAEEFAKSHGSTAIRLDTYAGNGVSNRFYENLGYLKVGTIKMPQYMPGDYFCYEKRLT